MTELNWTETEPATLCQAANFVVICYTAIENEYRWSFERERLPGQRLRGVEQQTELKSFGAEGPRGGKGIMKCDTENSVLCQRDCALGLVDLVLCSGSQPSPS